MLGYKMQPTYMYKLGFGHVKIKPAYTTHLCKKQLLIYIYMYKYISIFISIDTNRCIC